MRSFKEQHIEPVAASDILMTARNMKADGYRMIQICATKVSEGFEIIYSFDKDHELFNFKLTIPEEEEVQSITGEYWSAFIYENEMKDLFGIKVINSELDYGGHFFKVSEPTPWNPKN